MTVPNHGITSSGLYNLPSYQVRVIYPGKRGGFDVIVKGPHDKCIICGGEYPATVNTLFFEPSNTKVNVLIFLCSQNCEDGFNEQYNQAALVQAATFCALDLCCEKMIGGIDVKH